MSKITFGRGDDGFTGILGAGRVPKYHPRPEAYGEVDEASAAIGLARALSQLDPSAAICLQTQRDLFHIMAELAVSGDHVDKFIRIGEDQVAWLEAEVDRYRRQIELPREFVIPGDSPGGAAFHVARTVVRRAERAVARLLHDGLISNTALLRYMNRLSSLLFYLALAEDRAAGAANATLAKKAGQ